MPATTPEELLGLDSDKPVTWEFWKKNKKVDEYNPKSQEPTPSILSVWGIGLIKEWLMEKEIKYTMVGDPNRHGEEKSIKLRGKWYQRV